MVVPKMNQFYFEDREVSDATFYGNPASESWNL